MFKLYTHPSSANGRKVLAITIHLDLKPNIIMTNVYAGDGQTLDYLAVNPFGKIPTLVHDDFVLWESNAIMHYISDVFGDFSLSSTNPKKRADIERWLFWESSHWQPSISNILSEIVGHRLLPHIIPEPKNKANWLDPNFNRNVTFLNNHLKDKRYLLGSKLSIADFSIAGMMTYFRVAKFPFILYENIHRWYTEIESLDAWKMSASEIWN